MVKDFFQAQFLLTLPLPGHYSVSVGASLVDHEGRVWHTGPEVALELVAEGEEREKQQQQEQQQQQQQQRERERERAVSQRESGGGVGKTPGPVAAHRM